MIDVGVEGDTGQLRETARWLRAMSRAADDAGADFRAARGRSEPAWVGRAGDGFRHCADRADGRIGALRSAIDTAARELEDLACEIDEVRALMALARDVACAAGLCVVGGAVLHPAATIDHCAGRLAPALHAYAQVERIVACARTREHGAHATVCEVLTTLDLGPECGVRALFEPGTVSAGNTFTAAAKQYAGAGRPGAGRTGVPDAADAPAGAASRASSGAQDDLGIGEDEGPANGAPIVPGDVGSADEPAARGASTIGVEQWSLVGGVVLGAGAGLGLTYGMGKKARRRARTRAARATDPATGANDDTIPPGPFSSRAG